MENENFTPAGANQPLMMNEKVNPKMLEEQKLSPKEFADGAVYKPTVSMDDVQIKQPAKYIGLTKEELQRYADDPFWKRLRYLLLILFWVAWIAMFVAAIIIVATSPKCPPKPSLKWWQKKVCYQIWTKSFQDSNGDGVGDIAGINQRVKQLASMKVQSIWPVPLLHSQSGSGYDVLDFKNVDPRLGTLDDFDTLIKTTHKNYMKFVMDIPLGVVSVNHTWFKESVKLNSTYKDFFIWHESPRSKPDHWQKQVPERSAFYYHWPNLEGYAVMNWENEDLREEMKDVLKFWLDRGVDGFYFGKVEYMSIGDHDNPQILKVHEYLKELTDYARNVTDRELLLFSSINATLEEEATFALEAVRLADLNFVIHSHLVKFRHDNADADRIHADLTTVSKFHDEHNDTWPMWEIGNPYYDRVATRMQSTDKAELLMMLHLLLPGSVNTYYGDEIGMTNLNVTEDSPDFKVRQRSLMQWSNTKNGGFSTADKTEAKINEDYPTRNLEDQISSTYEGEPSKLFKRLAGLRNSDEAFLFGPMTLVERSSDDSLLALYRTSITGTANYLCVLNFAKNTTVLTYDLTAPPYNVSKTDFDVSAVTMTSKLANRGPYQRRSAVDVAKLGLAGSDGILLKLKKKA